MNIKIEPKCGGKRLKGLSGPSNPDRPLITVVTVVFNGDKELEPTILSMLNQSYKNVEYIIVDGGSTDGTLDLVRKYESSINYWVSEQDKGVYDAMNKGLSLARGQWVYYLNCGDTLASPDVLQRASAILEKTKFHVVAGFVLVKSTSSDNLRFPLESSAGLSARSLFMRHFCHQALFIARQAYLDHNGFDLSYPTFSDFDVCWKIISSTNGFENVDLDIAAFAPNGLSSDYRKSLQLYMESERIFAKANEERSFLRYWAGAARSLAYRYKLALAERFK